MFFDLYILPLPELILYGLAYLFPHQIWDLCSYYVDLYNLVLNSLKSISQVSTRIEIEFKQILGKTCATWIQSSSVLNSKIKKQANMEGNLNAP